MNAGLTARVRVSQGSFTLDAHARVADGRVLAVVGPNGAGKSTLLRCLAGLRSLESGQIVSAGTVWDDPAQGTFVRPAQRSIGVLFQDYRLFPTMSVLDNVAFGLRASGMSRREAEPIAAGWLARIGVDHRADARPTALSGGESQRVALARALAPSPSTLLLDEPFAALDAEARLDLRADLARTLADFPGQAIMVTHDPTDALALADDIVVLTAGRVVDEGVLAEVLRRPRSPFVAKLVGLNLLGGQAQAGLAQLGPFTVPAGAALAGAVFGCCPPTAVTLTRAPQSDAHPARVTHLTRRSDGFRVGLDDPVGFIVDLPGGTDLPSPGETVWVRVPEPAWQVYPAAG